MKINVRRSLLGCRAGGLRIVVLVAQVVQGHVAVHGRALGNEAVALRAAGGLRRLQVGRAGVDAVIHVLLERGYGIHRVVCGRVSLRLSLLIVYF